MTDSRSVAQTAGIPSDKLRDELVAALEEIKARDVTVLDVRKLTDITDYMIIASGTSNRHVKAVADSVADAAKSIGMQPMGVEGKEGLEWVLLDLGDVLVHVMHPDSREFYNLEGLWSDFSSEG